MAELSIKIEVSEIKEVSEIIVKMATTLTAASNALRSYQYGNVSEELAKSVADMCDETLKDVEDKIRG